MCLIFFYILTVLIVLDKLIPYLIPHNTTELNKAKPYRLNLSLSNRFK